MEDVKKMPLEWFVFIERNGNIVRRNIFWHWRFWEDLCKIRRKFGKRNATGEDRKVFEQEVGKLLAYYYRSKCEWEVVITSWPYKIEDGKLGCGLKVDVYDQVKMNYQAFLDYLWNNRMKLKEGII